jgi:hypothetical protein
MTKIQASIKQGERRSYITCDKQQGSVANASNQL